MGRYADLFFGEAVSERAYIGPPYQLTNFGNDCVVDSQREWELSDRVHATND